MKRLLPRSPNKQTYRQDPWRRKILVGLGLLAMLTYAVLVAGGLKIAHDREVEFASRNLENLGRVLEGHARSTIDKIDTILLASQLQLDQNNAVAAHDQTAFNTTLGRYLALINDESQSLRVADANGSFIHDASGTLFPARIQDRDYFRQNRDDTSGKLVISEPLFARITHNWVITLSRRLNASGGQFAGLVQAAVRAEYFQDFFANLDLGPGQSITLIDAQRRLIARYPIAREKLGQPLESSYLKEMISAGKQHASYTTLSAVDGIERLYVVRQVGNHPLYVLVGHAESDYLANWYQQLFWGLLSILVLTVVLSGWIIVWLRTYDRAREIAQGMTSAYETTFRRTRALLDSLPDPAWLSDREYRLIAVNDAYAALAGKPAQTILGQTVEQVWPEDAARLLSELDSSALTQQCQQKRLDSQLLDNGKQRHFEYVATPVFDDKGELAGVAGVARDITQLRDDQERIRHLAEHDLLTDLPNRSLLSTHMASALAETLGPQAEIALLFLDLDHFKNINDTLGHEIGDQLLLQVAQRLRANLDERDTISRQGGDEFAILIRGYGTPARLAMIAQRINDVLSEPFAVESHELRVSASIGISTYPQDGQDIGALLKNADTAMYQAKAASGNTYRFFMPEMNASIFERVMLENSLRRALHSEQIHVHYQPQVDVKNTRLIGFEALVRWHHPEQGNIPPSRFIPIAEESSLINQIGDQVLREACRQNRAWQDMGLPPVVMAVNLSAMQLRQSGFAERVATVLTESKLAPQWLELEITESAFIRDTERIIEVLQQLSALGIKLSVDDFGTGYSSLGYLKRLPFDRIKIDQSFVRDLPDNTDDIAIVRAIIAIAESLQKEVIAEGVEQPQQIDFLLSQGCRLMQGYHFGRPSDAAQAEALLRQEKN
ncbi:EAL domain-containing protein [Azonexus sp.]|uniref:bifunctional diguanylate cyclase/phosphodiesterase n=1 Tax=Azonexus sp. TaxID=1872668 RepID=UPI0027BAAFA3|nr:EAL domain-containing protein [Azonexus sp.]